MCVSCRKVSFVVITVRTVGIYWVRTREIVTADSIAIGTVHTIIRESDMAVSHTKGKEQIRLPQLGLVAAIYRTSVMEKKYDIFNFGYSWLPI